MRSNRPSHFGSSARGKSNRGAALLFVVLVLLFCVTWLTLSLAKSGRLSIKQTANATRADQAFAAADAGVELGYVYLVKNRALIVLDANSNGLIDAYSNASITNVVLANGSSYTVTYSNPTVSDLTYLRITSIGTSDNASREVRLLVKYTALMSTYSPTPLAAKGNVSLAGNTVITNTLNANTLQTGGTVSFGGNAKTVLSTGNSSSAALIKSDVSQSNASLSALSAEAFFVQYFGAGSASIKASVAHYYNNSVNANYNATLNGMTNTSIWIDQSGGTRATIDSNTTIGSAANPVLLVVNGDLTVQGNAVIYGYIYATGSITTAGNSVISGAMVAGGNTIDSGNFSLTYNTSVLNKVQQLSGQYGKVPNSWNDLKK